MNLLEKAIQEANLNEVKELLINDPNMIETYTESGVWMPYFAAFTGNLEIVRYIVEYSRASFNTFDPNHRSILHYAVESGNLPLVKYLVEKVGMSPVLGDMDLITPFELAASLKHNEIEAYFEEILGCSLQNMYKNPIQTGMHPDPSIIRVGEDYYMVNSSFIYFPCIPISHSKDLIHWEVIGHAITNPDWAYLDELEGGRGYWAPDISYYNERFYITATYRLNDTGTVYRKQMVVSSDRPEGPYCEPSFIDEDGIDPSIFTDDDGKRYMLLNRGARIFEISSDGTKQLSDATLLYYGDNKRAPEGPHILKKDGYYYLFMAEGGTGPSHCITVARSKELFGNYEPCPYNPIMTQVDKTAPIQRCGHGKPVQTQNGEWYIVYLCGRMIDGKYSLLGRETALDPITWTPDGWPIVNNLKGPSTLQKKPNLPETIFESANPNYNGQNELNAEWVTPRAPEADGITIKENKLHIKGSKASISTMYARNILLIRQKHFNFTASATLLSPKLEVGQHTGLTCYYDENTYLLYGVFKTEKGLELKVFEHIDESNTDSLVLSEVLPDFKEIDLKIVTKGLKRTFIYGLDNNEEKSLGTLDNVYYICDEGIRKGKRFTGAMVGMYAYSGDASTTYGVFSSFNYEAN